MSDLELWRDIRASKIDFARGCGCARVSKPNASGLRLVRQIFCRRLRRYTSKGIRLFVLGCNQATTGLVQFRNLLEVEKNGFSSLLKAWRLLLQSKTKVRRGHNESSLKDVHALHLLMQRQYHSLWAAPIQLWTSDVSINGEGACRFRDALLLTSSTRWRRYPQS